jgi:DNA-binding response OmpR family regulator
VVVTGIRGDDRTRATALLVDDDKDLLDLLGLLVERVGITPLPATEPATALELYGRGEPSVAVVDLNLGPWSGFELVAELRKRSAWLPIIVLTVRGSEDDKVRALEVGADDYLVKPFGQRELIARIRAHLRRGARDREMRREAAVLELGPLRMNVDERAVALDGQELRLTGTEFRLLQYLLQHQDAVIPIMEIARRVWGYDDDAAREVVRVTLHRLRRKIGDDAASPRLIHTIPGVGVRLRPSES